ncbi:MAG: hypothetical protein NT049_14775 [Planctomycetota bacterium]|nr:hypothetical protein [Planctomycetota bacterium]
MCVVRCISMAVLMALGLSLFAHAAAPVDPMSLKFAADYQPGTRDSGGKWMGGTETMSLLAHGGKLFAGLGDWMDVPYRQARGDQPWTGAQILVKDAAAAAWRVDLSFGDDYLRTESLFSATFTTDAKGRALAPPALMLIAGPSDWNTSGPRWATAWTRDDATGRWTKTEIAREPRHAGARSFATHLDKTSGVHHLFAGVSAGAIFRGAYDPEAAGRIRWQPEPELTGTGRPMAMAETGGVLYAACGIKDDTPQSGGLFRRIDGPQPKWELVYRWPYKAAEQGDETTILRGLTAVPDPLGGKQEVFIATRAFGGAVQRIDPTKGFAATVELNIRMFFAKAWGVEILRGPCLSAYNRFVPAVHPVTGEKIHLMGVWVEHPQQADPPHNGSYYLVRRADGTYEWGCVYDTAHPVAAGSGLHGTRAIEVSPFPEDRGRVFYFGGHDCAYRESHNTAWIYRAAPM